MGLGPKTVNVNPNDLPDRVCECGCKVFAQALALKELPMVLSETNRAETVMGRVGFVCVGCGKIIPLRPEEPKAEDPKKEESSIILTDGGHA